MYYFWAICNLKTGSGGRGGGLGAHTVLQPSWHSFTDLPWVGGMESFLHTIPTSS